jgi:hypothetical protein
VKEALGPLPRYPHLQTFHRWLGPLADRLCGGFIHFAQSGTPLETFNPYPLSMHSNSDAWQAANRMLGVRTTRAPVRKQEKGAAEQPLESTEELSIDVAPEPEPVITNEPSENSEAIDACPDRLPVPPPPPTPGAKKPVEKPQASKRGRQPDTDPKQDQRIAEAWETGQYVDYAGLARELHIDKREVKRAVDRHRKRLK